MSAVTFAMGLLPGYAQWGLAASLAMVGLRVLQGFCVGGELPGAITYVTETAPRQQGFAAGVIFFCVNTGVVVATLLSLGLDQSLTPAEVGLWGWRIAYVAGGVLGLVSFWLRLSLEETAEFSRLRHAAEKRPFQAVVRAYPAQIVVGIAACAGSAGFNGLLFAYLKPHLTTVLHYTAVQASAAQNICLGVLSVGLVSVAWLGDRIPRRWLLGIGGALGLALCYPFFQAAQTRSVNLYLLAALAGVVASFLNGACVGVIGDLFPTRIRYSGVALGFNLSFSLGGALAPLVATSLVKDTGQVNSPAGFMAVCAALTLAASLVLKRYEGRILGEADARDAEIAVAAATPAQ
jgi:MFS family permease